jgi:hypothetical protein
VKHSLQNRDQLGLLRFATLMMGFMGALDEIGVTIGSGNAPAGPRETSEFRSLES